MPDETCQMKEWHEYSETSPAHPIPAEMTQLLLQEPEQVDSCGIQSPAKPSPGPSGPIRGIPMDRVSVWRWKIQTGRASPQPGPPQRLPEHITRAGVSVAAWDPLPSHPSCNGQESGSCARCKVLLFSAALCKSLVRGMGRSGEQDSKSKPPFPCSLLPEQTIPPSSSTPWTRCPKEIHSTGKDLQ